MENLQLGKEVMLWIQLQNSLSLEHWIVHAGKGMLHRKAWAHSICNQAYSTGLQAGADFNLGYLISQGFLNILNQLIVGLGNFLSFLLNFLRLSIIQIQITTANGLELLVIIFANGFNSKFIYRVQQIENLQALVSQQLHLRQFLDSISVSTSSIVDFLLALCHTAYILLQGDFLAILGGSKEQQLLQLIYHTAAGIHAVVNTNLQGFAIFCPELLVFLTVIL